MRVALTGAATGIGAEIALRLKRDGHEVTAIDISDPGENVDRWIEADLSDPDSIGAAIDAADGPFDALINNAGLPPKGGQEEMVLRVNFFGLRTVLDGMLDKLAPGAAIVNTASRAGAMWRANLEEVKALITLDPENLGGFIAERGIDATRAYCLSKEAIIMMTIGETGRLAARGLRMNSVSPAAVNTGILPDFAAAFGDRMTANLKRAGRPGTPGEIAEVILFMASPDSGWIKGQDIVVDGGMGAMAESDSLAL